MLLLPAKILFRPLKLKRNSKTKVDVQFVRQFFAKPMLAAAFYLPQHGQDDESIGPITRCAFSNDSFKLLFSEKVLVFSFNASLITSFLSTSVSSRSPFNTKSCLVVMFIGF
ncbi:hypothetical protein EON73_00530 [bacterium]|nr:MAG: hypothetical protein EON73_00530 [bacterium]